MHIRALQVFILISLKIEMDSFKNLRWIIPFKKFSRLSVDLSLMCSNWFIGNSRSIEWKNRAICLLCFNASVHDWYLKVQYLSSRIGSSSPSNAPLFPLATGYVISKASRNIWEHKDEVLRYLVKYSHKGLNHKCVVEMWTSTYWLWKLLWLLYLAWFLFVSVAV